MSVLIAAKLYYSTTDETKTHYTVSKIDYIFLSLSPSLSLSLSLSLLSLSPPPFLSPLTHQKFQTFDNVLVSVSIIVATVYLLVYEIWCQVNYSTALWGQYVLFMQLVTIGSGMKIGWPTSRRVFCCILEFRELFICLSATVFGLIELIHSHSLSLSLCPLPSSIPPSFSSSLPTLLSNENSPLKTNFFGF